MTDISAHVCSLDIARRLNKLGVKHRSLFEWMAAPHKGYDEWECLFTSPHINQLGIPAYIASELHKLIPQCETYFYDGLWRCNRNSSKYDSCQTTGHKLVDCLAFMLIVFIESGLIKMKGE